MAKPFQNQCHNFLCRRFYFVKTWRQLDRNVESATGNDANSGTANNSAWQSLSKINATTFSAGDFILLKRGGNWTGTLNPKGSGTSGNPIILSSYGTTVALPLINGNGNTD